MQLLVFNNWDNLFFSPCIAKVCDSTINLHDVHWKDMFLLSILQDMIVDYAEL